MLLMPKLKQLLTRIMKRKQNKMNYTSYYNVDLKLWYWISEQDIHKQKITIRSAEYFKTEKECIENFRNQSGREKNVIEYKRFNI